MAQVPVTLAVMVYPKDKDEEPFPATIVGYAWITGLGVGGGPIVPPTPPGIPPDRPGIWPPGPGIDTPEHPIVLPPDEPAPPDISKPSDPKPPPSDGGWGWHPDYGWGYFPGPGEPGPKRK